MQYEKVEIIIQDNENGNIYDVSELVGKVSISRSKDNSAGKCSFSINTNIISLDFGLGSTLSFKVLVNGKWYGKFFGYIFNKKPKYDSLEISAYDQLIYLSNEETYVLTNQTQESIIKKIGSDFGLRLGTIEGVNYYLPERIEDGVSLGDVIQRALDYTLMATKKYYIIRDEFGYLCCRDVSKLVTNIVIGDNSLLSDFTLSDGIDSDSYNQVKLYQDNEDTGKRETYVVKDSANISKWGILQLRESVDENMNADQIKVRAEDYLSYYNRSFKSLSLSINGIIELDVGNGIYLDLEKLPEHNQLFLISKIDHTFENGILTSKLEVEYE